MMSMKLFDMSDLMAGKTPSQGEREINQGLRKSLLKYRLHQDLELFARAYTYIREYY